MPVINKRVKVCPDCKSKNIEMDKNKGEIICGNCGLVLEEEAVDKGKEWRAFDMEQVKKKSRTGPPRTPTRHDKGLTTSMGRGKSEISRSVSNKKKYQYYRLKKWHRRITDSKKRNLAFALSELSRYISYLDLPKNVHERVAKHYEQAVDMGLVRGRSIEGVLTALIYAVAKDEGTPRTMEELVKVSGRSKRKISSTYRFISRELGLRILPADPVNFIPRFRSRLHLSGKTEIDAIDISKRAKNKSAASGKAPTGVAATAIYMAAKRNNEDITQREVSRELPVTEVTIRNNMKEFSNKLQAR